MVLLACSVAIVPMSLLGKKQQLNSMRAKNTCEVSEDEDEDKDTAQQSAIKGTTTSTPQSHISPKDILQLVKITEEYLCAPDANVYEIDFTRFKIRDLESGTILFEIEKPPSDQFIEGSGGVFVDNLMAATEDLTLNDTADPNAGRYVRYQFTPAFLNLKAVGAT